ncbi:hypothetical protein E3N88_31657 [Mikania micrantha]|uniref:Uncharacterized protein n=1 Tax=Mikania micrantha TaxID=192012 RepID=A0A5N6M8W8_9ASTR|nr:hypothetical protein E3N88_31657 [Mikania micrantha]
MVFPVKSKTSSPSLKQHSRVKTLVTTTTVHRIKGRRRGQDDEDDRSSQRQSTKVDGHGLSEKKKKSIGDWTLDPPSLPKPKSSRPHILFSSVPDGRHPMTTSPATSERNSRPLNLSPLWRHLSDIRRLPRLAPRRQQYSHPHSVSDHLLPLSGSI